MNACTKVSGKGQIVVPKATRDRLGWRPGTELELVEADGAVVLRRVSPRETLSVAQAVARLREIYRHEGPPVPLEELGWRMDVDDS